MENAELSNRLRTAWVGPLATIGLHRFRAVTRSTDSPSFRTHKAVSAPGPARKHALEPQVPALACNSASVFGMYETSPEKKPPARCVRPHKNTDERAREANFQILTAHPFNRNRAILDRRFAALIESLVVSSPTELGHSSSLGRECKQLAHLPLGFICQVPQAVGSLSPTSPSHCLPRLLLGLLAIKTRGVNTTSLIQKHLLYRVLQALRSTERLGVPLQPWD